VSELFRKNVRAPMQEHPVALGQVRDPRRVLGEPEQVIEVPALDALDDAAELLGPDLLDGIDGKGTGSGRSGQMSRRGRSSPDSTCLSVARSSLIPRGRAAPSGPTYEMAGLSSSVSPRWGEAHMVPSGLQHLAEGGGSLRLSP